MSVRVVDLSGALKQALYAQLADNLGAAATRYRAELSAEIGTQGPPRSDPGEAPHRDTGALIESITDELDADELVARVGSDSPYALALELGGGNIAARPAWMPVLIREADELGKIICRS